MAAQTRNVLAKVDSLLADAGTDKSKLLSASIWLKDINADFKSFNAVWNSWVDPTNKPVRATVEAALARPQLLVEIQASPAPEASGSGRHAQKVIHIAGYRSTMPTESSCACIGDSRSIGKRSARPVLQPIARRRLDFWLFHMCLHWIQESLVIQCNNCKGSELSKRTTSATSEFTRTSYSVSLGKRWAG